MNNCFSSLWEITEKSQWLIYLRKGNLSGPQFRYLKGRSATSPNLAKPALRTGSQVPDREMGITPFKEKGGECNLVLEPIQPDYLAVKINEPNTEKTENNIFLASPSMDLVCLDLWGGEWPSPTWCFPFSFFQDYSIWPNQSSKLVNQAEPVGLTGAGWNRAGKDKEASFWKSLSSRSLFLPACLRALP